MELICPLCKRSDHVKLEHKVELEQSLNLYICNSCKIFFKISHLSDVESYYSKILEEDIKSETTPLRIVEEIYNKILYKLPKESLILDFGCGGGEFLAFLKAKGYTHLIGVELNKKLIEYCMNRGFKIYDDISAIEDNLIDFVLMIEVLEHLNDPVSILKQIKRVLKKNGGFLITTPNSKSLKARILRMNWKEFKRQSHIIFFNYQSLFHLLKLTGFSNMLPVKNLTYTNRRYLEYFLNIFNWTGNIRVLAYKD